VLSPDFFQDAELLRLSPLHRLLFAGLWCWADRKGRLEDKPRDLKLRILPLDECDVDVLLDDLAEGGFVERYQASGQRCIWIPQFGKYQRPHLRERDSQLPAPTLNGASTDLGSAQHQPRHSLGGA
jgi:hypothetical protein